MPHFLFPSEEEVTGGILNFNARYGKQPSILLNNFTRLQPYKELITTKGHASMVATCCACAGFSQLVLARVEQQPV